MHRKSRSFAVVLGAAVLLGSLGGCGGKGPLDAGLDLALDGTWKGIDGLVVEFAGGQATIVDFGSSPLGTNATVLQVGEPFIRNISCGPDSCTGQILDPEIVNGILQSYDLEGVEIERSGDQITLWSDALPDGLSTFTPADGEGGGEGPGTGQLTRSSSCAEWWAELTRVGSWKVTYYNKFMSGELDVSDWSWTFTQPDRYVSPFTSGEAITTGTVGFDDNYAGRGLCRIKRFADSGHQMSPFFPISYEGGAMRLSEFSDREDFYMEITAN